MEGRRVIFTPCLSEPIHFTLTYKSTVSATHQMSRLLNSDPQRLRIRLSQSCEHAQGSRECHSGS